MINFDGEAIPYHKDTKLIMTSKINSPQFLPDIFIRMNVINFSVTRKGLEDQILAEVMKMEKPEDEKMKNDNIERISEFKKKMRELEKRTLELLVNTEGSPVDDENLVSTLQISKETFNEIKVKLVDIEKIDKEINIQRELYRSVGKLGSILFFVV